ncbi:hypothetical protein [Paenarthrobacter ureafaciens]|uniref:hypothetical protein n=1 Tax=Paenarthrobacter ureafaciens TaxID=37931 RepID=UPI001FB2B89B|nr:hypothetical protein [Paenarthrobacter ureafaciens]UOD80329.1 hypothetical protein MQZ73_14570 [Paenarthrobacter ureafaciens]WNZ02982.1 hypothetical protein PVT25_15210 [Paenarthrobacter ureafaciens]
MSLRITYTTSCDCGGEMTSTTLDLSQSPSDSVIIDLDMIGDMTLTCGSCDDQAFLPDLGDYIQDVD